jgi:hypothetical protein
MGLVNYASPVLFRNTVFSDLILLKINTPPITAAMNQIKK